MKKQRTPKQRTIYIVWLATKWVDATNDITIGTAEELIEYVNSWNIVVKNESSSLDCEKFWYNRINRRMI